MASNQYFARKHQNGNAKRLDINIYFHVQDELNISGIPPAREAKTEVTETQGEMNNCYTFGISDNCGHFSYRKKVNIFVYKQY